MDEHGGLGPPPAAPPGNQLAAQGTGNQLAAQEPAQEAKRGAARMQDEGGVQTHAALFCFGCSTFLCQRSCCKLCPPFDTTPRPMTRPAVLPI